MVFWYVDVVCVLAVCTVTDCIIKNVFKQFTHVIYYSVCFHIVSSPGEILSALFLASYCFVIDFG